MNTHIIESLLGEEGKKWIKNVFKEIMAKEFPNLNKETDIQEQEGHRLLNKTNPDRPTPRDN